MICSSLKSLFMMFNPFVSMIELLSVAPIKLGLFSAFKFLILTSQKVHRYPDSRTGYHRLVMYRLLHRMSRYQAAFQTKQHDGERGGLLQ